MMSRVNDVIWWPGISKDVENLRSSCHQCCENAPSQPADPPEGVIMPSFPFQHLSGDFYEIRGMKFLILVDRYKSWPVVYRFKKANCEELIKVMRKVFESYGIPETFHSDGGRQFTGNIFQIFSENEVLITTRVRLIIPIQI